MNVTDTIAAIATPEGVGAIAIVRMSGPQAVSILSKVWISGAVNVDNMESHRLYYGKIGGLSTELSLIDQVLAVLMKGPHSYTGENMVEIHCHGGRLVPQLVLQELLRGGARLAEAGEFTQRAYLNGKLDLAQAEAVADVIHAVSREGLRRAEEQLQGSLSVQISEFLHSLKQVRMSVEAAIDFPDEHIVILSEAGAQEALEKTRRSIVQLLNTYGEGRLHRLGAKIVLAGRPNVGKSSLLNRLLGSERAIVHGLAGTTRDTIEESLLINGIAVRLIDTAGLRQAEEDVESIGIERSHAEMRASDLILFLIDRSTPLSTHECEMLAFYSERPIMAVLTKSDLPAAITVEEISQRAPFVAIVEISALTGEGIEKLKSAVTHYLLGQEGAESVGISISHLRHKELLERALHYMERVISEMKADSSPDIIAISLQQAMRALGDIVGNVSMEEMLQDIFSKFCVGK